MGAPQQCTLFWGTQTTGSKIHSAVEGIHVEGLNYLPIFNLNPGSHGGSAGYL